jgi:hypothetical protein
MLDTWVSLMVLATCCPMWLYYAVQVARMIPKDR